jgi:hypothetical protein
LHWGVFASSFSFFSSFIEKPFFFPPGANIFFFCVAVVVSCIFLALFRVLFGGWSGEDAARFPSTWCYYDIVNTFQGWWSWWETETETTVARIPFCVEVVPFSLLEKVATGKAFLLRRLLFLFVLFCLVSFVFLGFAPTNLR